MAEDEAVKLVPTLFSHIEVDGGELVETGAEVYSVAMVSNAGNRYCIRQYEAEVDAWIFALAMSNESTLPVVDLMEARGVAHRGEMN